MQRFLLFYIHLRLSELDKALLILSLSLSLSAAIEHILHSHVEREEREKQIESYKRQIEELNTSIAQCQEQLPASGVPITRQVSHCGGEKLNINFSYKLCLYSHSSSNYISSSSLPPPFLLYLHPPLLTLSFSLSLSFCTSFYSAV